MFARKKHLFSRRAPALFVDGLRLIGYAARNAMFAFLQEQLNIMRDWIKHLQHPLVLAGFALFIMLEVFQVFFRDSLAARLSGTALEKLLGNGMTFAFILSLVSVIGGITLSFRRGGDEQHDSGAAERGDSLITKGRESPAVKAGGTVKITYGNTVLRQDNVATAATEEAGPEDIAAQDCLKTEGGRSPAVKAGKDVEIHIGK
jgi:hypothetical protein